MPDYILTNQELETMVETSDEWITSRTGIKGAALVLAYRGPKAVQYMLAKTSTDPK